MASRIIVTLFIFPVVFVRATTQLQSPEHPKNNDDNDLHDNVRRRTTTNARDPRTVVTKTTPYMRYPAYGGEKEFKPPTKYMPAEVEDYFLDTDRSAHLQLNRDDWTNTCDSWTKPERTTPEIHQKLNAYVEDLDNFNAAVERFEKIPDVLKEIKRYGDHSVCEKARIHPDGIQALFPSNQLSYGNSGYMDPLLPSLRHPKICVEGLRPAFMSLDYLVHDFETLCLKLKPTSRLVLIDMGASLDFHHFHNDAIARPPPIVTLLNLYEKFGFNFDHIYAFEITKFDADKVFRDMLPEKYMASYHWINTGVNATKGDKLNPLHSILKTFEEDDFIVVKLDIDTPDVEFELAQQLLLDEDDIYGKLIDQFYFEHHVLQKELKRNWKTGKGSVLQSLQLFSGLRKKGIPAHHWV